MPRPFRFSGRVGCVSPGTMRPAWPLLLAGLFLLSIALPAHTVRAQSGDVVTRTAGETTNLFARIDLDQETAGFEVTLPPTWELLGVSVLHYGSEAVPAVLQLRTRTTSRILPERPVQGPHVLVLRVRPSDRLGSASWSLTPLRRTGDGRVQMDRATSLRRRVTVREAPAASDENRVLQLRPQDAPLYVRPRALPPLSGRSPLTVEFWMATTETDQILVSTWTGNEQEPYPLEVIVDPSGYVRGYTGRPGRHEAVVSETPLADGQWHHVAATYDPDRERLRLYTNGVAVDSLRLASLPAPLGPVSMAVGGRLPERASAPDSARYTGRLDELRVWPVARTAADLQRTMRRPLTAPGRRPEAVSSSPTSPKPASPALVLGFSNPGPEAPDVLRTAPSPDVLRPSTLRLQGSMLHDLRARPEGGAVHIQWSVPTPTVDAFVVERSVDGQRFVEVARVTPEDERAAGAEDAPGYSVRDDGVAAQVVYYRVVQEFDNGTVRRSATLKVGLGTPDTDDPVRLIGNFPNPFTDATTVAYEIDAPTEVDLSVWDLRGQKVSQIAEGVKQAGYHEEAFDASALPSGPYFLRLRTNGTTQSHRMVVLR